MGVDWIAAGTFTEERMVGGLGQTDEAGVARDTVERERRRPRRRFFAVAASATFAILVVGATLVATHHAPLLESPAGAGGYGPTVSVWGTNGLALVDPPGHSAILALREDPDSHNDAIIASIASTSTDASGHAIPDHLNPGAGCRYLSQTDSDPSNDLAPGYNLWLRCSNVTGPWVLALGDGADQVSVAHPTRTTMLTSGKNIQVLGGAGNDTISILNGSAEVYGEQDNDTIRGGPYDDILHGGPGLDTLIAGPGQGTLHDVLYGDEGNDTLRGGRSSDVLDGGAGLDILTAGGAHDTINGRDSEADEIDCGGDDAVADALHFDPGVDKTFHCAAEIRKNPGGA
ncbi:MAG TPA: calcium-binding protein [Acidimicrobiia bacterium]|nr:calcium-binding protein [Acidimicrobiia bacterium]